MTINNLPCSVACLISTVSRFPNHSSTCWVCSPLAYVNYTATLRAKLNPIMLFWRRLRELHFINRNCYFKSAVAWMSTEVNGDSADFQTFDQHFYLGEGILFEEIFRRDLEPAHLQIDAAISNTVNAYSAFASMEECIEIISFELSSHLSIFYAWYVAYDELCLWKLLIGNTSQHSFIISMSKINLFMIYSSFRPNGWRGQVGRLILVSLKYPYQLSKLSIFPIAAVLNK